MCVCVYTAESVAISHRQLRARVYPWPSSIIIIIYHQKRQSDDGEQIETKTANTPFAVLGEEYGCIILCNYNSKTYDCHWLNSKVIFRKVIFTDAYKVTYLVNISSFYNIYVYPLVSKLRIKIKCWENRKMTIVEYWLDVIGNKWGIGDCMKIGALLLVEFLWLQS